MLRHLAQLTVLHVAEGGQDSTTTSTKIICTCLKEHLGILKGPLWPYSQTS